MRDSSAISSLRSGSGSSRDRRDGWTAHGEVPMLLGHRDAVRLDQSRVHLRRVCRLPRARRYRDPPVTVWIARVSLVMALVLGVEVGVQTWRLQREQGRAVDARAASQDAELSASGWARIAAGSRAELARIVPALEAEIAALKKSGATFAGSSHWTGHGTAVAAPCTVIMGPPAGDTTADLHPPPPPGQPVG